MIYVAGPGTAGPAWWPTPGSKAPTARSIPHRRRMPTGCSACSSSFQLSRRHSQPCGAGDARLHQRRRRTRLLRCRTPTAPRSTIPIWSSRASSATARPKPGRWRHPGTPINSSIPASDGAVLPILHLNGYKIANPDSAGPYSVTTSSKAVRRLRLQALFRRGRRSRRRCTSNGRRARQRHPGNPRHPVRGPRHGRLQSARAGR